MMAALAAAAQDPASQDAALLAALPGWALAFMLVLCRVSAVVMLLPGPGDTGVPAPVRIGLAVALTLLLLPAIAPLVPRPPDDPGRLLAMVVAELFCGLTLGMLARLLVLAMMTAGQIVALMTGLSNVLNVDPALGAQSAAVARLMGMMAPLILLATGLYALPLGALAGSYGLVPPGNFLPVGDTVASVTAAAAQSFALALRLAGPFVLASMMWQVATGALARLVPQLQVHFAAMPGQIFGGLLLLGLLMRDMADAWQSAAHAALLQLPGL